MWGLEAQPMLPILAAVPKVQRKEEKGWGAHDPDRGWPVSTPRGQGKVEFRSTGAKRRHLHVRLSRKRRPGQSRLHYACSQARRVCTRCNSLRDVARGDRGARALVLHIHARTTRARLPPEKEPSVPRCGAGEDALKHVGWGRSRPGCAGRETRARSGRKARRHPRRGLALEGLRRPGRQRGRGRKVPALRRPGAKGF